MKRLLSIIGLIFLFANVAAGQNYPNRALRIVVPLTPGGGNDTIARLIAQRLTVTLKQQVVVDNRPGAGGLIGADYVAKSAADGYTLLLGNVANMAIIPNIQKNVPYDPLKDFAPVSLIASAPLLVVVHPSLPVKSIKQLIAFAKARPGQLNYASNGVGTTTHLATAMFAMMTDVKLVHVPYKGLSAAMGDLMGGQVPLMFSSAVAMLPHVKSGRLRVLAMTGAKRSPAIPDIPTVAESGVPGYEAGSWYGIVAPTGTPRPVIDLLSQQIAAAAKAPDMARHLAADAVVAIGSSPEQFATHIKKEFDRVHAVVSKSGARFE